MYPASLGLSSADFYQNTSSRQFTSYVTLITRITELLNAPNQTVKTDIRDITEFEIKLANISRPYEKNGGAIFQRLNMKKLSKVVPAINWKRYFELAIPVEVNDTELVGIYGLDYFMDVQELISATPNRLVIQMFHKLIQ